MRNIMEQYTEKPEILMLTQQSLQSENFKEMLSRNTGTKITIIDAKTLATMNSSLNVIFYWLISQLIRHLTL